MNEIRSVGGELVGRMRGEASWRGAHVQAAPWRRRQRRTLSSRLIDSVGAGARESELLKAEEWPGTAGSRLHGPQGPGASGWPAVAASAASNGGQGSRGEEQAL